MVGLGSMAPKDPDQQRVRKGFLVAAIVTVLVVFVAVVFL
jgi:hypothetical protein